MDKIEAEMRPDFRKKARHCRPNADLVDCQHQLWCQHYAMREPQTWFSNPMQSSLLMFCHPPVIVIHSMSATPHTSMPHGMHAEQMPSGRVCVTLRACTLKAPPAALQEGLTIQANGRWQQIKLLRAEWAHPRAVPGLYSTVLYITNLAPVSLSWCGV